MTSFGDLNTSAEAPAAVTRRRLILRDSFTFLSLSLLTIALFTVTLFLFRSFASHRTELGKRWSARGAASLSQGKPELAVEALRTALSYAPGERSYELLLAQALAASGHTDEAFNYFSGLWDTEPGNGFINLQLARLAARRRDQAQAVNFYRASIYGTWEGDGSVRRRDVRLELAQYLIETRNVTAARAELLVAQGNADNDAVLDLKLGHLFVKAGDRADALEAYLKATEAAPKEPATFVAAGQLAFAMDQFPLAKRLLQEALRTGNSPEARSTFDHASVSSLLARTDRLLDLVPSHKLPAQQRVIRLLEMQDLARLRLDTCTTRFNQPNPQLQDLDRRWSLRKRTDTRTTLLRDPARQDDLLQLIYETELDLDKTCGPATGDNAVVVLLAHDPGAVDR